MDLSILLCWQMFVVALASSAIVTLLKRVVPNKVLKSKTVNKLMPIFPTAFAMLFSIPIHPDELITTPQILIWSLIAGVTSAWTFKLYKTMFIEKLKDN